MSTRATAPAATPTGTSLQPCASWTGRRRTVTPGQRLLAALLVAVTVLAVPVSGSAAPAERDRQAGQLFYEGRYEEALRIYIELAFETKRPEYMCNIGRCYARLGRIDEAIHNMRDCLAQAPLDARKRAEYETHVRALEAQRAQGGAPAAPPAPIYPGGAPVAPAPPGQAGAGAAPGPASPPAPGAAGTTAPPGQTWPPPAAGAPGTYPAPTGPGGYPAPGAPGGYAQVPGADPGRPYYGGQPPQGSAGAYPGGPGAPPGPAVAPPLAVQETRGKAKKKKRLLPFASYVTGGVGLVAVTAGVAFGLQSKGIYDDLAVRFDPDQEREAKRANTAQIVSYAVGGVALGAAVVIAILGRQSDAADGSAPVALVSDGQSAGWSWRF